MHRTFYAAFEFGVALATHSMSSPDLERAIQYAERS
jgi:hypothetical protein